MQRYGDGHVLEWGEEFGAKRRSKVWRTGSCFSRKMTIRAVSVSWTIPHSCHRMKTSILEWVGRVPWSTKWSPDMSVFVVFAKPPLRLRAAIFRAACQAKKVRGCSSVTEAMTLNSTVFFFFFSFYRWTVALMIQFSSKKLNRTVKPND